MDRKPIKKRIRQNQRKIQPKPPMDYAFWKLWGVRGGIILFAMIIIFFGGRALNTALSVTHWNIDASASIKREIGAALQAQNLDFWHTRSSLLREKLLHKVPDLADVLIQRQLPDTLNIQVRLRKAIGLWENEQKIVYLVDKDGLAYRPLRQGEAVNVPILRVRQKYLHAASDLMHVLESSTGKWFALTSEVLTDGLVWKLNFNQGQQWLLPFGLKTVHSVARLSKILEEQRWREKKWRINIRMDNRWFFREVQHEEVI